ncbi:hypothetical protein [Mycobacterium branderi]|uniref:hypothetical protein n=1 Tax=Mycobacterium branderi TaxID=43348 RepID=UPI00111BDE9E|nr:hypothetical protein [Mycobacterium branderi]MCV7235990.1 hypothetical protein [Mycobacterium branderi]
MSTPDLPQLSPNPQINNGFDHQSKATANRKRSPGCDSSDEKAGFLIDNCGYPSSLGFHLMQQPIGYRLIDPWAHL